MLRGRQLCGWTTAFALVVACQFPEYDETDIIPGNAGTSGSAAAGGAGLEPVGGQGGGLPGNGQAGSALEAGQAGAAGQLAPGGGGAAGGAADDNLLFFDDFESGADAWSATTPADWSVQTDGDNNLYRQAIVSDDTRMVTAGDSTWTDVAIQARVRVVEFGGTDTADLAALYVRFQDLDNHYYVALRSDGRLAIKARFDGSDSTLGSSVNPNLTTNVWYTIKLAAIGNVVNAYVDGVFWDTVVVQPDKAIAAGAVGLGTSNASAEFDDVTVTALE